MLDSRQLARLCVATVLAALLPSTLAAPLALERRQTVAPAGLLTDVQLTGIRSILDRTANYSWEIGTHIQALLEYDHPQLSVYSNLSSPFPPPTSTFTPAATTALLRITSSVLAIKEPGTLPLIADGSAADPAAIGVGFVLANLTAGGADGVRYGEAADQQIEYLMRVAPRTSDGAISHRAEKVQLWSDFVYMVPPYLAYYGVIRQNRALIDEAYNQCRLYRQYLKDPNGLWKHILLSSDTDPGYWASGNGWAAAGMLRVLATFQKSSYRGDLSRQINDLSVWVSEILDASFPYLQSDGLFSNYLNETTFSDGASTAILAATSYRLASMGMGNTTLAAATIARNAVLSNVSPTTGNLQPVVNPMNYPRQLSSTGSSPEGQAFVLIMEASKRDYDLAGGASITQTKAVPGTSGSMSTGRPGAFASVLAVGLAATLATAFVF